MADYNVKQVVTVFAKVNGHVNAGAWTSTGPGQIVYQEPEFAVVANQGMGAGACTVHVDLNVDDPNTPEKETDLSGDYSINWKTAPVPLASTLTLEATATAEPA